MRRIIAVVVELVIASLAYGQSIPLEVKGDVKVVKVDKVIVVKEDRTVVSSLPFTVEAPAGAGLYFWTLPAGVQASDRGDKLEVLAAPKGALTITVKAITADVDKDGRFKGFKTQFGSVSFDVGAVTPTPPTPQPTPPGPEPTPAPDDKLGFTAIARNVAAVPLDGRRFAAELANNFESVAAQVAAGKFSDVDAANNELRTLNRTTLGTNAKAWLPWFDAWGKHADQLNANGALRTVADYAVAYRETAAGLRAAQ